MIDAADAVVWVNDNTKRVMVRARDWGVPEDRQSFAGGHWTDSIGAAYLEWQQATTAQRMTLMLETAIDLAMQGIPLADVLRAFAEVREFRALGDASYPMCRALTSALVGRCLEFNTMTFEQLLETYARESAP